MGFIKIYFLDDADGCFLSTPSMGFKRVILDRGRRTGKPFNSLNGILTLKIEDQELKQYAFNSLNGILICYILVPKKEKLSTPSMGFNDISRHRSREPLPFQLPQWDSVENIPLFIDVKIFQLPQWDSGLGSQDLRGHLELSTPSMGFHHSQAPPPCRGSSFNSLNGIRFH